MKALQFPLTRITLFFTIGILVSHYTDTDPSFIIILSGSGLLLLCSFYYFQFGLGHSQKTGFGITTFFISFFIGMTTQAINDSLKQDNYSHYSTDANNSHYLQVSILEKLKSSAYKDRYVVLVKKFDTSFTKGKLLLNIQKDSLKHYRLEVGSNLLLKGNIVKHKPPNNPDQFDYGQYLSNKSITAQMFTDNSFIRISSLYDRNIWYYSARLRNSILDRLQKSGFGTRELNVAAALILGQQQEISADILRDYQFAGAVHILSVSGLHVGYILLFVNFALSGLARNKSGNFIRLATTLILLWLFAVIAGFSPSIIRSVTMFSFVAIGMYLKRETYIFHTLIVSILLILIVYPSFLFDVGFQLSYVSLFFILWLQPMLSGLWVPDNKIIKYLWDIITVSVAAQAGAFPLSIYYFHQFPGLFFITNIVILPGLGIIMALGVFVMIMAAFDYVPELPAKILEWLIHSLNSIISRIATFEQFIIQDIPLNIGILISLYLLISAIILWFARPSFRRLAFAFLTFIAFQVSLICTVWFSQKNREFIVFHSIKRSILAKRNGQRLIIYSNDSILKTIEEQPMVKTYMVANFVHLSDKKPIPNTEYFSSTKILIIDSTAVYPKLSIPDVLILIQSPKINLERLLEYHHPRVIIADGSNYKTYVALWKETCRKQKIPFHATAEKGFYRLR